MRIDGPFEWNTLKNAQLKLTRGVAFVELLADGVVIRFEDHPRHAHQKIMLVQSRMRCGPFRVFRIVMEFS